MKTKKIFGYGLTAVLFTLAFAVLPLAGCNDGNGTNDDGNGSGTGTNNNGGTGTNNNPGTGTGGSSNQNPAEITVTAGNTLAEKLQWVQDNALNNTVYTIAVSADEAIAPHTLDYGNRDITVIIGGNEGEKTVSLSSNGAMFTVSGGVTLNLTGITLQGRSGNNAPLLRLLEEGTLIMNTGVKISGNTGAESGGGVFVSSGTFTMNGGEISGNTGAESGGGVYVSNGTFTMAGGKISNNTAIYGGGVHMYDGTFTLNGGEISGNNTSSLGSGVYVSNGTFTMNGGEISGNNTSSIGSGVAVSSGTFTMNNGKISGNTATYYGGGVYASTFTMNGGTISGNTASSGGGVAVNGNGTFTMNGGEISGNTGAESGGGVAVNNGTFTMSGGEISGNTAANYGGGIYVEGYNGTFRIVTGTVYGSNEETLSNTASSGAALHMGSRDSTTAQRGTFSGTTWTSKGSLSATDNTIRVVNGELQ